jgi:hypothetical protein
MTATDLVGAEYWATFWEWIADKAFILVVIFLAVEYIAGRWAKPHREALENTRKLEIAQLTKEGEQARAAIADSNARAAEASQKAAEAQLALEQYKAPRWIADARAEALAGRLRQFHDISVDVWLTHATSADAAPLATRLLGILRTAQWNANGVFNLMGGPSGTGILIATRDNPSPNDQAAAAALLNELNSAGITATAGKGVTDSPVSALGAFVGPNASNPPSNLWVLVGSKP